MTLAAMMEAVKRVAESVAEFTTDEVMHDLGSPVLEEPRMLGTAMLEAKRLGWIESTGRAVKTKDRRSHGRAKTIWRSKLHAARAVAGAVSH